MHDANLPNSFVSQPSVGAQRGMNSSLLLWVAIQSAALGHKQQKRQSVRTQSGKVDLCLLAES